MGMPNGSRIHSPSSTPGGIEPVKNDIISVQMRRQAQLAIDTADVIIFLADGREGITSADEDVAEMLRRSKNLWCLP